MFKTLFGRSDRPPSGPFHRPYRDESLNRIYNLLFCDNLSLLHTLTGSLGVVMSNDVDRDTLDRIGNDLDEESRTRAVAFSRLRAMKVSVPRKRLLGAIIEVPLDNGLDVIAMFDDKRLRYINQTEKVVFFEDTPPDIAEKAGEVLRLSQMIVNKSGPWNEPRRPPPKGNLNRMSFLVSDGLYFCEGDYGAIMRDRSTAPVMNATGELLVMVVDAALEKERRDRGPSQ